YDMRFNTDIKITSKLTGSIDLVLNESNVLRPGQGSPETIIQRMIAYPAITPGRFDSGQWGEGWSNNNPAAQALEGGSNKSLTSSRVLKGTLVYKPIESLELLATYSNNSWGGHTRHLVNQYEIYTANTVTNSLDLVNRWPAQNSLTETRSSGIHNQFRAQATYSKSLNEAHNFKVLGG